MQNHLLLVPYRNELCTKQDLQYLLAFFTCLRNRFPDADASQLAEADIRLPSQREISAWDAVALLAGKQLIEGTMLKGPGRRIWWKNLLLLKATSAVADLLAAIDEAASIKVDKPFALDKE